MTREQHIDWCKQRATEYVERGDVTGAFASMASDIGRHNETAGHPALEIGTVLLLGGHLASQDQMRRFIEGFN